MVDLTHYRFDSQGNARTTPISLFALLDKEFHFEWDLAADNSNHLCPKFYTLEDNALSRSWQGTCFCNPPFGRDMAKFVEKAYIESQKSIHTIIVMLLPVRSNTKWWHKYCMKSEIRFVCGRPKFSGQKHGLPWPIAVVVFGGNPGIMKSLYL